MGLAAAMGGASMDTIARKTPVPLPFDAWQAMTAPEAAYEVHDRLTALSARLRRAAVAWVKPEAELAAELEAAPAGAPLRGVPYALKDLFDVAGVPTFAGSSFLPSVRPTPGDSAVVRDLRRLGATFAVKTHLVEFASGLTGENPHYGDCPHPRFPDRLTGGSSSGSAALVAAGVVPLAIGTDTGGSIRVPAAFCGLYGFRLTPRDELIRDAFPLAPTMDTAGWFTGNAPDMLCTLGAILDGEARRPAEPLIMQTAATQPEASPYSGTSGHPRGCFLDGQTLLPDIDPVVNLACSKAAGIFCPEAEGNTEAALLNAWYGAIEAYVTIGMSEAHAVHRDWLAPYRAHYDPVIWQRFHDAGGIPREKIEAAHAKLAEVRAGWTRYFQKYDFLILPAAPHAAPTKAECTPELRRNLLTLTAPASLGGLPCLTIPVGLPGGLTTGLQVVAAKPDSPAFEWVLRQCAQLPAGAF
jgi:Asp-tRNA(Asn)/Glu-tRNA(Gln) amidotransferase A subunit family amidase